MFNGKQKEITFLFLIDRFEMPVAQHDYNRGLLFRRYRIVSGEGGGGVVRGGVSGGVGARPKPKERSCTFSSVRGANVHRALGHTCKCKKQSLRFNLQDNYVG